LLKMALRFASGSSAARLALRAVATPITQRPLHLASAALRLLPSPAAARLLLAAPARGGRASAPTLSRALCGAPSLNEEEFDDEDWETVPMEVADAEIVALNEDAAVAAAAASDETARLEFAYYGLNEGLQGNLRRKGIERLFPVQAATLAEIIEGHDVVVRSRTGSGKTIAFALPILERMFGDGADRSEGGSAGAPRCIVLTPTRELAKQVHEEFRALGPRSMASLARPVILLVALRQLCKINMAFIHNVSRRKVCAYCFHAICPGSVIVGVRLFMAVSHLRRRTRH